MKFQLESIGQKSLKHPPDLVQCRRGVARRPGLDVVDLVAPRFIAPFRGAQYLKRPQFVSGHYKPCEETLRRNSIAADPNFALQGGSAKSKLASCEHVRLNGSHLESRGNGCCRSARYLCLCTDRGPIA